ncbi:MHYT domain-containing protein [Rhizobium sp. GN54]|uniref:MHYT domain-containing protein n=1 Tax=Rhizobium sp. GN54 TaxID=2898150 RepID=UPI001E4E03ED|nr:MHYT domain-containing protein [Rhizobium sp. GN54]MCD2180427.1 LytTR family transcriptional regulator DNA-binding domain-containing protein [Rhizobium sp. GN54]
MDPLVSRHERPSCFEGLGIDSMNEMAASFSYNLVLVVLSILVAIQAGYVGISLAILIPGAFANRRRLLIAGSATTLAVGIWSMHFIGMLAVTTDITIDYAVLPTLLSFFVCGLVTGIAIYLASLRSQRLLVLAAIAMGLGITTMHYVGMVAIHSVVHLSHDPAYMLASVTIAIAASGLALWLAFSADRRPPLFLCAVVLGCAVSGMHYLAMAGTTMHVAGSDVTTVKSVISSDMLAIIVSVIACSISAVFMLALIPADANDTKGDAGWTSAISVATPREATATRGERDPDEGLAPTVTNGSAIDLLPIEKNGNRFQIAVDEIASVHSNAHYTYIFNGRDDLFCPLSITDIDNRLQKTTFFRTHRSYIVNLDFVIRIKKAGDAGVAELDTPVRRTVPVSRARMVALRQELAAFKATNPTDQSQT